MRVIRETIYRRTNLVFGNQDSQSLRNVPGMLHGLYRYLLNVRVTINGSMTQTAATALLAKEFLWGVFSSLQFRYAGKTLMDTAWDSLDVTMQNIVAGLTGEIAAILPADLANAAATPTLFRQVFHLPFAEEWVRSGRVDDDALAGMVPLGAIGDTGVLDFTIRPDQTGMGDWDISANTTLTVLIELDVLETARRYLCSAPLMSRADSTDNPWTSTTLDRASWDMLMVYDPGAAFAIPTGDVYAHIDGVEVVSMMTGQALLDRANAIRAQLGLHATDAIADDLQSIVVDPLNGRVPRNQIVGKNIKVQNVGLQNSVGTTRYLMRRLQNPDEATEARFLAGLGLTSAVGRDQLYLNGVPAVQYPGDELIGSAFEIR